MNVAKEYRYNRLTWEEMNEAIAMQKVVILPTGSTEQHGRHLPLDVDAFLTESVCLEVGRPHTAAKAVGQHTGERTTHQAGDPRRDQDARYDANTASP